MKKAFITTGTILGCFYLTYGIFKSTNSTASVGVLFYPFYGGLGAYFGYFFYYLIQLFKSEEKFLSKKSLLVIIPMIWLCHHQYTEFKEKEYLDWIKSPERNLNEQISILKTEKQQYVAQLAQNPKLDIKLIDQIIEKYSGDIYVLPGIATNPKTTLVQIEKLVRNVPQNKSKYDPTNKLYQTFVLAPIVRSKKMSKELLELISIDHNTEHFLALAISEYEHTNCEQIKKLLPRENLVLENMLNDALQRKNCP